MQEIDYERTQNSQVNFSSTKMSFKFPKNDRFISYKKPLCENMYTLPNVKNMRATSLGFGKKFDFGKLHKNNPPPTAYDLTMSSSFFKNKGYSFGLAREVHEKAFLETKPKIDKEIPGPGMYNTTGNICNDSNISKSHFFGAKEQFYDTSLKFIVPGPGTYNSPQLINKRGNSLLSIYKNYGSGKINPIKSSISLIPRHLNPGPGNYEVSAISLNSKIDYKSSMIRNPARISITTSKRILFPAKIFECPGPGKYQHRSEFGISPKLKKIEERIFQKFRHSKNEEYSSQFLY